MTTLRTRYYDDQRNFLKVENASFKMTRMQPENINKTDCCTNFRGELYSQKYGQDIKNQYLKYETCLNLCWF